MPVLIEGTDSPDQLWGTFLDDVILAYDRNDFVPAAGDNDTVFGGEGSDVLYGEGGNDYLNGGGGSEWMEGGFGDDKLVGENVRRQTSRRRRPTARHLPNIALPCRSSTPNIVPQSRPRARSGQGARYGSEHPH